jgi:CBS-domain-containing membrane protein
MRGTTKSPPAVGLSEIFWSWIGAFLGIAAVALFHYNRLKDTDLLMIIGSFGASAALIYGAIKNPLAQPRNLLGGHVFSDVIGVTSYQFFHSHMWPAASVAVATVIAFMHATKILHPPGGATALIEVIGSEKIHTIAMYMHSFRRDWERRSCSSLPFW